MTHFECNMPGIAREGAEMLIAKFRGTRAQDVEKRWSGAPFAISLTGATQLGTRRTHARKLCVPYKNHKGRLRTNHR